MNGDFYDTSPYGTLGATAIPADGLYWVGAEGRTLLEGPNRYLRLTAPASGVVDVPNSVVYQRVGAPADFTDQAAMSFKVRLPGLNDEAWVTFAEAGNIVAPDRDYWQLANCARVENDPQSGEWLLEFEDPQAPHGWRRMQPVTTVNNQVAWVGNINPQLPGPDFQISSENVFINKGTGALRIRACWTAPYPGVIRIASRLGQELPRFTQVRAPIRHRLYKGSALLREVSSVAANDFNGTTLINRLTVAKDDVLYFEVSRASALNNEYVVADWDHVISYEGRRLSYRFVRNSSQPPPAEPGQVIVNNVLPNNAWTAISLPTIGTIFKNSFSPVTSARPPLEIILSTPSGKTGDFDNASCLVKYPSVTPAQLRDEILAFTDWVRLTRSKLQDKGLGQRGLLESPYYCRLLQVHSDIFVPGSGPIGRFPDDHERQLPHAFNATDYLDLMSIHQDVLATLLHPGSAITSPFLEFDCSLDQYTAMATPPQTFSFGLSQGADFARRWLETGDMQSLDRAFLVGNAGANYGRLHATASCALVPPASAYQDLVLEDGYDSVTGQNSSVVALIANCLMPGMPGETVSNSIGSLTTIYSACRRYNDLHPTPPLRYSQTDLELILQTIVDATGRVASIKNYFWWSALYDQPGFVPTWGGRWQSIAGVFNDNYSAVAGPLCVTYPLLAALPNRTPLEDQALQAMRGVVEAGANFFLPLWDQQISRGGLSGGDQGKAWLSIDGLCNDPTYTTPNQAQLRGVMTRAAKHLLKFQHRSGAWTATNEDFAQFTDVSGWAGAPTPPPAYLLDCLGYAIQNPTINPSTRDDLICAVSAIIRAATKAYKDQWTYTGGGGSDPYINGFAGRPKDSHVAPLTTANPPKIDAETRVSDHLYVALTFMESLLALDRAPVVSISPADPVPAPPAGGQQSFQVTIHLLHPGGAPYTLPELDNQINNRTFVNAWAHHLPPIGSQAPFVDRIKIWPAVAGSYTVTRQNSPSGAGYDGATLTFNVPGPGPSGYPRFKIECTSASIDGLSDTAESHQQW